METLIKDIRYGVRSLLARPGFTALAVFTLAPCIGASTAIFSVVDGVLLRSLPYLTLNGSYHTPPGLLSFGQKVRPTTGLVPST